jgi:hypothetical protein
MSSWAEWPLTVAALQRLTERLPEPRAQIIIRVRLRHAEKSVSTAQQRDAERPELAASVAAADDRIIHHDLPRSLLVGCLEDTEAGVDRAKGRARDDELAVGKHLLQPLEVLGPDRLLFGRYRRGEVLTRWVDEVDPFRHAPSLPARASPVNDRPRRPIARSSGRRRYRTR